MMKLQNSKTHFNLMRAFAGESQARNRYTFAAGLARQQGLECMARVFEYTAEQEREHAEIFFKRLRAAEADNIEICAGYPVDLKDDVLSLLRNAHHNEYEEYRIVYPEFSQVAQEEGFSDIAYIFDQIAGIEQSHGDRFNLLAEQLQNGKLFQDANPDTVWVCLNCGYVYQGAGAPQICPVCSHEQGYYLREGFAPYTTC